MNDTNAGLDGAACTAIRGASLTKRSIADTTQADQVQGMVEQMLTNHWRIDILVNNVGGVFAPEKGGNKTTLALAEDHGP